MVVFLFGCIGKNDEEEEVICRERELLEWVMVHVKKETHKDSEGVEPNHT